MADTRKANVSYQGDGVQTIYSFPFDYLKKAFVKIQLVNGDSRTPLTQGTDYTVTDKTVTLKNPTTEIINIYRETSTDPIVSWSDSSVLRAADMTLQEVQMLHLAEETDDKVQENGMALNADGDWDARYHKIVNVIAPTKDNDVVNLAYYNDTKTGVKQDRDRAETAASNAETSEMNAKTSETNAKTSETNADVSEGNAKASETAAALSESKAKTSEINAKTSETKAKTSETNSKSSEVNAASSASSASASAALAQKWAESADSPDGNVDEISVTGKTQSSKEWAKQAKSVAESLGNPVSTVVEDNGLVTVTKSNGEKNTFHAGLNILQRNKVYKVGDIAYSPNLPSWAYLECTTAGTTGNTEPDFSEKADVTDGTVQFVIKDMREPDKISPSTTIAGIDLFKVHPDYYARTKLWTAEKRKITIPAYTTIQIGETIYQTVQDTPINLDEAKSWDSSTYATVGNRKGKDFYIYAVAPDAGTIPTFILSNNKTKPSTVDSSKCRLIGGFHCECADIEKWLTHSLSGWKAGEILPASAWDLIHRAKSDNDGMVYNSLNDMWISIYLLSLKDNHPASVFNGVILDGASSPKYHGLKFSEELSKLNQRLPYLHEYFNAFAGIWENVAIQGAKDPNTTGGHVNSAGHRIVSHIGCEDCAGVLWQWSNNYGMAGGSGWGDSNYNSEVDGSGYGRAYGTLWLPRVGGYWANGSNCGSRAVVGNNSAATLNDYCGGRAASDPRIVNF